MNCSRWRRDISAWIDGALPPGKLEKVRLHVETCPDCARFHSELSQMGELFESARTASLDPPPFLWQRIEARLQEKERGTARDEGRRGLLAWFGIPQLRYALGAGLLLLVTGVVAIRTRAPQSFESDGLVQLDAYTLEVSGNPFLAKVSEQNPFFGLAQQEPGNPFERGGVSQ